MTTYNTGNPIGSTDSRDRLDNSENLDYAMNSLEHTWDDRLGVTRDTFEGALSKLSFYRVGTFTTGYTLTNMRQTLEYEGHEYSWSGSFGENGKQVPPSSTPETSGGIGAGAWVDRTDVNLRTDLTANGTSIDDLSKLNTNAGASIVKTSTGVTVESRFATDEGSINTLTTKVANINGANGGSYVGHTARSGRIRTMDDVANDVWNINDFLLASETSWENAFYRVAQAGVGAVRLNGGSYPLYAPVIATTATKILGAGRSASTIIKAHTGNTFDVRSNGFELSDVNFIQDEVIGAGAKHILLNSSLTSLQNIRLSNIIQNGGSAGFLADNGGSNLIVDLALNDVKLQGTVASGIVLTKAFAFLDLTKVTVNYVPSSVKNLIGISVTRNEGSNFRWCHVDTGITSATPGSYGFAFSNCKAIWLDSCQADTVGVDGFRFDNCQYVYGNKLSASLCGGFGFAVNGGSNFMLSDCYAGGRRGLAYDGGNSNIGYNVTGTRVFLNNSLAVNCAGYGYAAGTGSSVMRGGAFANNTTNYSLSGANFVRGVMNDAGALIDAG